eukprot:15441743-Alexandrium_andersonii.AAC.1
MSACGQRGTGRRPSAAPCPTIDTQQPHLAALMSQHDSRHPLRCGKQETFHRHPHALLSI